MLGLTELQTSGGRELRAVLSQPKRFALLAFLASHPPRTFVRRDILLGLLWPELDQPHARGALSQALRFLRKELGAASRSVIINRGTDEIGIDSGELWCDVAVFRDHVDAGRYGDALELYQGDFLDGFFADAGTSFEEWLARERNQLRASAAHAARRLAELREREQNFTLAVATARRAVDLSSVDERVLRELLALLDRLGDRAGAIQAYDDFAARLAREFDAQPAAETTQLIGLIRRRAGTRIDDRVAITPLPSTSAPTGFNGLEIVRELGRGGMSTVYLARDVKHDRHVALKVMRPELAVSLGADRFLREIQITARLAHPHILPLIDSGTQSGALYLVTPYVAGESLRARLLREPALALDEALRIATETAEALDYAHRSGIIHRDIKPENILLADGHAIVADFGVARAVIASGEIQESHTTESGTVVGSPAYMSPEAAAGADGSVRTDLYSLGCVLFEMLTGQLPKNGEAVDALVRHHPAVPERVRRLVENCLDKDPERRPSSANEVLRQLSASWDDGTNGGVPRSSKSFRERVPLFARRVAAASAQAGSVIARRSPWLFGGALVGAALAVAGMIAWGIEARSEGVAVRFTFNVDSQSSLANVPGSIAMSPDGRQIAIAATGPDGRRRILVRSIGELKSRVLAGTEGAEQLFFSPDGQWIGFYVRPLLKKVPALGGAPLLIGEAPGMYGASWAATGEIVVSTGNRLAAIPGNGGTFRTLSRPDTAANELKQLWPVLLADGNSILYTARQRFVEESRIGIARLDGGAARILDLPGTGALGVIEGQLVYASVRRPHGPQRPHGGAVRCESRPSAECALPDRVWCSFGVVGGGGGEPFGKRIIGLPVHGRRSPRGGARPAPRCAARLAGRRARVLSPAFFPRWQPSRCQRRGTRAVRLRPRFGYTQSPDESPRGISRMDA
jgi:serine/threonine protein kinase/DNA-binding SARP family transcriptional activator